MRFIDLSTWDRAMHYQAFRNSVQPQYCVTFDLDITNFLPKIKAKGYSFTFAFVYAVTKCANQIEAFRCRFVDGKPAVLDTVNTSFTYLKKGTELFKVVNVPMQDSMEEYVALAKKKERHRTFQSCQCTNAGQHGRICSISQKNRRKSNSLFYRPYGKRHLSVFAFPVGIVPSYIPYGLR